MTDKADTQAKTQIWEIVLTVNQICKEGQGFDRLGPLFHDRVVMVLPGFQRRAEGKATCLRYYEDACSRMVFHRLDGSDERINVWEDTAVVTYKYDCVWDFQGKTFTDDGHEIQVFVRDAKDWRMVWRTVIPGSRRIQARPAQQDSRPKGQDIRETCLDLMATSPTCQLTTIDAEGFPHTTAMNNLRCAKEYPSLVQLYQGQDNGFLLYLSTSQQSDKMARIRANPKVSVYFCVPDQFIGLMLGGRIEVITDQTLKNRIWQQGWTMYYPNGPEGPEYGVLRLIPTVVKVWFQGRPFEFKMK
jgi:general stress protein 26